MNKIQELQKINKKLTKEIRHNYREEGKDIELVRVFDMLAQSIVDQHELGYKVIEYAKNRAIIDYLRRSVRK